MADLNMTLGSFAFHDFEIPEVITDLGGVQAFAVHQFPGGRRVVQPFGAFPHESIRWSGVFLSGTDLDNRDTFDRAQQLDAIRSAGNPVTFSYGPFSFSVLITSFKITPGFEGRLPYTIELKPISDLSQTSQGLPIPLNNDNAFSQLIGSMQSGIQALRSAIMTGVLAAASITNKIAALTNLLNELQTTIASAQTLLAINGNLIANISSVSAQPVILALQTLAAAFSAEAVAFNPPSSDTYGFEGSGYASERAFALAAQAQLAASYLNNPSKQPRTINVVNPNLLVLASIYYNDVSKYTVISAANGNLPLNSIGTYTLLIPALN